MTLTFGSLFAGVGGIDLGLERAGMRCVWQCEIDPFARRVLAKHWPDVRRHDDVRTFPPGNPDDWKCDLIAGGFPCQPVSLAGKGMGTSDERWLWPEFARVLRVLRPRFALLENTPGILVPGRGFGDVLGDLADLGFDAEWAVLPASALGARHIRARVFVVAYPQRPGRNGLHEREQEGRLATHAGDGGAHGPDGRPSAHTPPLDGPHAFGQPLRLQGRPQDACPAGEAEGRPEERQRVWPDAWSVGGIDGGWDFEPPVGRVADGVPHGMDRLRALGNAVVPQVAQWLGERIVEVLSCPSS